MKVLIVDDQTLFREGLSWVIRQQPDIEVVGEAGTVQDAVNQTLKLHPDIVLLELFLPDGNGIEAIRPILDQRPATKIIILTTSGDMKYISLAIRSGAKGYLIKDKPVSHLLSSIRAVQSGEYALSRSVISRIIEELSKDNFIFDQLPNYTHLKDLTQREQDVLELICLDKTNSEIAESLSISKYTVKVHIRNIFKKLNVRNRREAAKFNQRFCEQILITGQKSRSLHV